ncbi:hypothetical protein ACUOAQ_00685 [Escherichia sp. SP-MK]
MMKVTLHQLPHEPPHTQQYDDHPNVSGTAYTFFQSLIDTLGEEEAKEYVKNLAV